MMNSLCKHSMLCGAALVALSNAGVSHAQETGDGDVGVSETANDSTIREIVVTAQKRSERLEDVPMAITALDAESLEDRGVSNIQDLSQVTSGVQINYGGAWTAASVRGITAPSGGFGTEGNVALFIDGFYQPDNAGLNADFNNLQGVEILKGPQGTLYGRNSTGGAILLTTRAPSDTLTGSIGAKIGTYDDVALSGYLSGPLSERLRYSVSLYGRQTPGYYDFLDERGLKIGDKAGKMHNFTARTKLEADVSDNVVVTFGYNHVEYLDNRGNIYTPEANRSPSLPPKQGRLYEPYTYASNRGEGGNKQLFKLDEMTMKVAIETGVGTLTSYSGYAKRHVEGNFDFDSSYADLNYTFGNYSEQSWQQAVDFTLNPIGNLDVIVGGTYWNDKIKQRFLTNSGNQLVAISNTRPAREAWAVFADATYHLSDRVHINLGARYTKETSGVTQATLLTSSNSIISAADVRSSYTNFSPRGSIRFELDDRTNIFASITRGFRAGATGVFTGQVFPIRPENVTAYELGFKTAKEFFRFDTSAFYYDYKDLQVSALIPDPVTQQPTSILQNATDAEIYGVEAQASIFPTEQLQIDLSGTWLHARYLEFPNATGVGINPVTGLNVSNQSQDLSGKQMVRAPDFSATLAATYTFLNVLGGSLAANANAKYTTSYVPNNFSLDSPNGEQRLRQDGYVLVNGSLTWSSKEGSYELALWGNNLTNEKYRLSYNAGSYGTYGIWSWPRQVGVRVAYHF